MSIRYSPTRTITRSPFKCERAWYKKPRNPVKLASLKGKEKPGQVMIRQTKKGEVIEVHTHTQRGNANASFHQKQILMTQNKAEYE